MGISSIIGNLKLYASIWEVDNDGKMVLTKNGKVAINKEPLLTLLRLLGNSLSNIPLDTAWYF